MLRLGKPTVIVLINGGQLAIENLLGAGAVIEAFYPAMRGPEAIARSIFGLENRWGKLPLTMYPKDYTKKVDMYSFDMTKSPGRTYRYYIGQTIFPFGHGLSYTEFAHQCHLVQQRLIECEVTNIGRMVGDEVLLAFHSVTDAIRKNVTHPVP